MVFGELTTVGHFIGAIPEFGYRFILFDHLTLTSGLSLFGLVNTEKEIDGGHTSFYLDLTLAVGVAF